MHKVEEEKHVLITGGAGYLGSLACSHLLQLGYRVTVVDDLLYGGESLLAYLSHPEFNFVKANVCEARTIRSAINQNLPVPVAIMHLAGIVGFPACQAVGRHWVLSGLFSHPLIAITALQVRMISQQRNRQSIRNLSTQKQWSRQKNFCRHRLVQIARH